MFINNKKRVIFYRRYKSEKKRCYKKLTITRVTILVMVLSLAMVAAGWPVEWPKDATVISPAAGATVHMILVGMGRVVEKYTPIEHWIVQPLGGPMLWLPMMKEGKCHFANHNPDIINAFLGRGLYAKLGPVPVRSVTAGHVYMFMFWTTPERGVRSIADLKGKVAYIKFKANPMFTEMAKHQLGSAGLTFNDLKGVLSFSSIKEAIRDLIEGRVDAILYPAVPDAVMQVNEARGECIFIQMTRKQAEYVIKHREGHFIQDIAANDRRFRNKSPVRNAICYRQVMFCPADMHPDIVYGVVKAILEHTDEFADTHPSAKYWSVKHRPVSLVVPYHEGAIRYFKEKGLWTEEAQAYQDKMLKKQQEILKK